MTHHADHAPLTTAELAIHAGHPATLDGAASVYEIFADALGDRVAAAILRGE